jgi:hypothetical protein
LGYVLKIEIDVDTSGRRVYTKARLNVIGHLHICPRLLTEQGMKGWINVERINAHRNV